MPNIQNNNEEQILEESFDIQEADIKQSNSEGRIERNQFFNYSNYPFIIDFINRLIRPIYGTNIATSTRKFLKLGSDFLPSGVIECDATVVTVAGTAGETTLNSYTIPLNTISRNIGNTAATSGKDFRNAGNTFRVRASGIYTTDDGVSTFALALKVGAATIHTLSSDAGVQTNAQWYLDWLFIVSAIGTSATLESSVAATLNQVIKNTSNTSTTSFDTTVDNDIAITALWTGGSAGDTISIRQFLVELIN